MSPEREVLIRLGASLAVFGAMACWEVIAPWRALTSSKPRRWLRNLGLAALNALSVRLVLPAGTLGLAWAAARHGWGLFHQLAVPLPVALFLSVLLLDLTVYLQHVALHAVPALWRLHLVHHCDVDVDVTTGDRFHPLEILLSMVVKGAAVIALGAPPAAVLTFEVLLNGTSLFNHTNVELPARWERALRWLVVTPGMHRTHHSAEPTESDRNFGFNSPWWDRLYGTYLAEPAAGNRHVRFGVAGLRHGPSQSLPWLLTAPFRSRRRDPGERLHEEHPRPAR